MSVGQNIFEKNKIYHGDCLEVMKQIPILSGKAMIVEMPEGATNPFVAKTYIDEDAPTCDTNPQWLEWSGTWPNNILWYLPDGNWQIVGRLSELFYHDFDGLIEPAKVFDYTAHYWNYIEKEYQPIMQIESLESAILAEGWYLDDNPIKVHTWASENADDYKKQYDAAQSRVLSRERLLLLRRMDG